MLPYYDSDGMDEPTRRIILFPTFSHTELPTFQHEAIQTLQRQRHSWRMARGEFPVEDALDLINGFPPGTGSVSWGQMPQRTFEEKACWNISYFISMLETYFALHQLRGKLLEYEKLSRAGDSPLTYLQDVRGIEPFIAEEYSCDAIAVRIINGLDHGIRGRILDMY